MACGYFAKDLPRLMAQQKARQWIKYDVQELRGATLGIIGYGDIGRAVAKLGSVFGMRVIALRRHPFLSRADDPYCNKVYDRSAASRNKLMAESDYIVCSAPSTVETRGMINAEALEAVKPGAVFINLGRGPVVDDAALIQALKDGKLKGAALDVFSEEPLPAESEYWDLPNLLISPHNMDQTSTFMHEATEYVILRCVCVLSCVSHVHPIQYGLASPCDAVKTREGSTTKHRPFSPPPPVLVVFVLCCTGSFSRKTCPASWWARNCSIRSTLNSATSLGSS
jgi:phosphoglycerate dehydrogenase-like enzyme